ncbi:hypothetical protein NIES25_69950 (plasmid) [Nostoc linckia NIES-25]|nr:hypothetical protein NIES25_69950 [Nostoc linckia NIES-25]
MQKPLHITSEGFAVEKLKFILPQSLPTNQLFLLIRCHRLTEILELLESIGITGDAAIFMLAFFQKGAA